MQPRITHLDGMRGLAILMVMLTTLMRAGLNYYRLSPPLNIIPCSHLAG